MAEELEGHTLIVEVYDNQGNFEGEWEYDISNDSLTNWEEVDMRDAEQGLALVRYLLLTNLKSNCFVTWDLLTRNTSLTEFITQGVPSSIVAEVPRLSIVNAAVDRMYDCLCDLVLKEEIRIGH